MAGAELRIKRIEIEKVGCIDRLEIRPGIWTVIEGRNATGKTTALNALRSLVEPGHDPDLLQRGADFGIVNIELSDGVTITEKITPDKTTRTVRHPKMGKISKTREWIQELIDRVSFDPAGFLLAKPKDRIPILLEALPIKLKVSQLKFLPRELVSQLDLKKHALEVIGDRNGGLYGGLFSERTDINRTAKENWTTAEQLRGSMPRETEEDVLAQLEKVTDEMDTLQAQTAESKNRINSEGEVGVAAAEAMLKKEREELEAARDQKIEQAHQEYREAFEQVVKASREQANEATSKKDYALQQLRAGYEPEFERLSLESARLNALLDQQREAKTAREMVEKIEAKAEDADEKSKALTRQLEGLENLKKSLLSELPIQGLEVLEGEIFVDGIAWEHVNESRRHRIAVELMRLRHGKLGIMVLDRAEVFDSDSWESFKNACSEAGVPIIAARVADSDLTVRSE